MQFSKVGAGSLVFGLVFLAAIWQFGFSSPNVLHGVLTMLITAIVGGLIWFGLFVAVVGLLMLLV